MRKRGLTPYNDFMRPRDVALSLLGVALAACAEPNKPAQPTGRTLDPPAAEGSTAPRLSVQGDRIVLSWVDPGTASGPELRYALREGSGWSPERTVVADPLLVVDASNVPGVIPLAGGGWAAHWSTKASPTATHSRRLGVATSSDGSTWSAPQRPYDDAVATDRSMASLVPAASGDRFGITWLDGRAGELSESGAGGTALYWADWDGAKFEHEVQLDPRVCDCCKTSGSWGPSGPIVAYRDRHDDERRDISVVMRTSDNWSPPAEVHNDGWTLTACPTNGPAVASRGEGTAVGWFSGGGGEKVVRVAISQDGGRTLGTPVRVDAGDPVGRVEIAVLPDGSAAVAWLERTGATAEVRARRVASDGSAGAPVTIGTTGASKKSGYPVIAATGGREALVAWIDTSGEKTRIRAAAVSLP